jgi:hypothetical protein
MEAAAEECERFIKTGQLWNGSSNILSSSIGAC